MGLFPMQETWDLTVYFV